MTKAFIFFISACLLFCSCDNTKAIKDNADQNKLANDKETISQLNEALKKHEDPSQVFKVSADQPSVVAGRKGTKFSINPNDLVTESGKPLGQSIEVELKEVTNQGELLRANAQTISDGKMLISGGAYFIAMTSNGEQLKLKEGKNLRVQFPKLSGNQMSLFYGQRNDFGQMNWQKSSDTFKVKQRPVTDTSGTTSNYDKRKSDIDQIIDYVDSGYSPTPEEKKAHVKQRKNYVVSQKVYDEIGLRKLGWINCDRFWDVEETTELFASFNPQDSIKNANVYLVFKDINSVIQAYYYSDKSPQFENMPIGYKARLIAYTVRDEKVFAYSTDLIIAKGQKLALPLKEITDQDFKKLIGN